MATICEGDVYQWQGMNLTTDGFHYAYYTSVNGCDSTYIMHLTVTPTVGTPATPQLSINNICQGSGTGTSIVVSTYADNATDYNWSITGAGNTIVGTWSSADVFIDPNFTGQAIISVTANGCNGPSSAATTVFTVFPRPVITLDSVVDTYCGTPGGQVFINVSGNAPYTYYWSNGSVLQNLYGVFPGSYNVSVTDINGCSASETFVVSSIAPDAQEICIVTVDELTGWNMIIWEKAPSTVLSHYNIWRQTTTLGIYELAGSVDYTNMSTWIDMQSDPEQRAWKYKVSAVDTCGMESVMSEPHKTIHLTMSEGLGGDINLNWNHYEGFVFLTYYIHRYDWANGWVVLDSISSDMDSYTDTPPTNLNIESYRIAVKKDMPCVASGNQSKDLEYYSEAFSNKVNLSNVGTEDISDVSDITVYPNPFSEKTTITFPNAGNVPFRLDIYDIAGQLVKSVDNITNDFIEIDRTNLSTGFYMIELTGDKVFRGKVIVN